MIFQEDFVWGSATSAYQIEGGWNHDNKGLSIWDIFTLNSGVIADGQSGREACQHYLKMKEDVKLMAELGIKAYRFSIAWTRILPNGIGQVNHEGILFYQSLVDELKSHGIEPYVTLFHWDYPYELHKKGGWLNKESVEWFAYYASIIGEYFGQSVKYFITFNEPQVFVGCGYQDGIHAPGLRLRQSEISIIAKHIMLAHGRGVEELRKKSHGSKIGFAPMSGDFYYPVRNEAEDIEAARQAYEYCDSEKFIFAMNFWCDPILLGKLPKIKGLGGSDSLVMPTPQELTVINQPLDFIGINIYQGKGVVVDHSHGIKEVALEPGYRRTAIQWPVTPECIYWASKFIYDQYGLPLYISENGMSCHDGISLDGGVHDHNRMDYIQEHLFWLNKSIQEGCPVQGYFYWSFMDNFEWANGYNERFGLVYIDYKNQSRIKKDSFYMYQSIIKNRGLVSEKRIRNGVL